jgi:hypothetical protein
MTLVRRLLALVLFAVLLAVGSAFASAPNIYITQSGSPSGKCTSNVQAPAFFNNSSNWGSGENQIGPGTTVLLCGTFNFGSAAYGFLVQASGTSTNPITIKMDTGAVIEANAFGGYADGTCNANGNPANCPAGISDPGFNYIILDGGTNGVVKNLANGSPTVSCAGTGTACSVSQSSIGVYAYGNDIIVRNFSISHIYDNAGANPNSSDSSGLPTADIRIDNASSGVLVCNNSTADAYAGIWGEVGGTAVPATSYNCASNSFPSSGVFIVGNTTNDQAHQLNVTSFFANATWVAAFNQLGDFTNWIYPSSAFHTDGIQTYGGPGHIIHPIIYDNYFHGDCGQAECTGLALYCALASNGDGSGCSGIEYRDLIIGTGSLTGSTNTSPLISITGASGNHVGPVAYYFNTFIGGCCTFWNYDLTGSTQLVSVGNIMSNPGVAVGTGSPYFYAILEANPPFSDLTVQGNLYDTTQHSGNTIWQWGSAGTRYSSLSSWRSAATSGGALGGADSTAVGAAPNLNSNYQPNSASPVIGIAPNETSMASTYACINQVPPSSYGVGSPMACGATLPSTGAWDAGAIPYGSNSGNPSPGAPAPPTDLRAIVN